MRGFYLISLVALFYSCDVFDTKEEEIPGFVVITSADLQTNANQGANTSNIVDATVFVNSEFAGTFELPAIVPILHPGTVLLQIGAGIKNNGLTNDRQIYPFYDFYEKEVTVIPDAKVPITSDSTITFQYFPTGINYEIEDFEQVGSSLVPTALNNAQTQLISSPPQNVRTNTSYQVVLAPDTGHFNVVSNWGLSNLPKGSKMYLEIDYKGTVPLDIGIVTLDPSIQFIFAAGILPKTEYTKVYIELTEEIAQQVSTNNYEIYLNAQSSNSFVNDSIFIDNLKFVYP